MKARTYEDFLNESIVKQSAGIIMYKISKGKLMVFIGKLGGETWKVRSRNWSIPKGNIDKGERPIDAAKREFNEEIGTSINFKDKDLEFIGIAKVPAPWRKDVKIWATEGNVKYKSSNTFKEEYPKGSGIFIDTPEISEAGFYDIDTAITMVHEYQVGILLDLKEKLN